MEAAALLRAALREPRCRLHLPLFILIGLYTGQRKEAILSLRWPQVDLDVGRIDFNAPGEPANEEATSAHPDSATAPATSRRARLRGTELGFVINEDGRRLRDVKRGFASACRRAGLEGCHPHVLRHTCATWLMQRGVDKWEAAAILAMTIETLERVYGHHHPDYLQGRRGGLPMTVRRMSALRGDIPDAFTRYSRRQMRRKQSLSQDQFSEGRGHRFESCRVRQFFMLAGIATRRGRAASNWLTLLSSQPARRVGADSPIHLVTAF